MKIYRGLVLSGFQPLSIVKLFQFVLCSFISFHIKYLLQSLNKEHRGVCLHVCTQTLSNNDVTLGLTVDVVVFILGRGLGILLGSSNGSWYGTLGHSFLIFRMKDLTCLCIGLHFILRNLKVGGSEKNNKY